MGVGYEIAMHSRFGEQLAEYLSMALAGLGYPDRIAGQPLSNLLPSGGHSERARNYSPIRGKT